MAARHLGTSNVTVLRDRSVTPCSAPPKRAECLLHTWSMSSFEIVDDVEEIVDTSDAEEQAEFQTSWLHLKRHTSPTNADIGKDVRAFPPHALILDVSSYDILALQADFKYLIFQNQPSTSSLLEHEVDNDRDEMDFLTQFQVNSICIADLVF